MSMTNNPEQAAQNRSAEFLLQDKTTRMLHFTENRLVMENEKLPHIDVTPIMSRLISVTIGQPNVDVSLAQLKDEVGKPAQIMPNLKKLNGSFSYVCGFNPWYVERSSPGGINRGGNVLVSVGLHTVHPDVPNEVKKSFLGIDLAANTAPKPAVDGRLVQLSSRLNEWKSALFEAGDTRIAESLENADLLSTFLAQKIIASGVKGVTIPELFDTAVGTGVFSDISVDTVINSLRRTVTPSLNPVSHNSNQAAKNRLSVIKSADPKNPARLVWKPKQIAGSATDFLGTEETTKY